MASGDDAVKIVDRADLADCGPMVHDKVEKNSSMLWFLKGSKKEEETERVKSENSPSAPSSEKKDNESSHHSNHETSNEGSAPHKEVVHEGEGIRSTYDVEEDVPPSYLEQLKRKVHWHGR